jgi:hypothetical protein
MGHVHVRAVTRVVVVSMVLTCGLAAAGCSASRSDATCTTQAKKLIDSTMVKLWNPPGVTSAGGHTFTCTELDGHASQFQYHYDATASADPLAFFSPDRLPGWHRTVNKPDELVYRHALRESEVVLIVSRNRPGEYVVSMSELPEP